MRPEILYPFFMGVETLPGIGAKSAKRVAGLAGPRVFDLLCHLPSRLIDRRNQAPLAEILPGSVATLRVQIIAHKPAPAGGPGRGPSRRPHQVIVEDATGTLLLTFFHRHRETLEQLMPEGETRLISGLVEAYGDRLQMVHPDYIVTEDKAAEIPALEPVYPLTAGLSGRLLQKAIGAGLTRLPSLPDWHRPEETAREKWPPLANALEAVHRPEEPEAIEPGSPARRRLAYDELLSDQLALLLIRRATRRAPSEPLKGDDRLVRALIKALPFSLTNGQTETLKEIRQDLEAPERMVRLVQGDVGAGKTVVALLAIALAVDAGGQAAFMAPTEILARQHHDEITRLAEGSGLRVGLLVGGQKPAERRPVEEALAEGALDLVIGTHALFQEKIGFSKLRLAVIDEQHRFGVAQRLALTEKGGPGVNLLVMTATPIPRTMALALFGDMDLSELREKPAGRKPVDTRTLSTERLEEIIEGLGRAISRGDQVYWVCPAVEDGGTTDLADALSRHAMLEARFPGQVALVHGRLSSRDKEAAMAAFLARERSILVATTVIEVGVNNPNATVMVIENAERFGLAQLHQLRGRVGRGEKPATCLLVFKAPLGETAKARLDTLRRTNDGFDIAEEDFRLRGPGDLLGRRQSGQPYYRLAEFPAHGDLLTRAHDDAKLTLHEDPFLKSSRGEALRLLLALYERDAAVRLLSAG